MNYGYSIDDTDFGRAERIGSVQLPWADTLAATVGNAWVHNPNSELYDLTSLYLAKNPWARPIAKVAGYAAETFPGGNLLLPGFSLAATSAPDNNDADRFVDPATLNKQYGQSLGLSFDTPQRKGAVDIMVGRTREQKARDFILAHGPQGYSSRAANFATSLATSAIDPLNVAAAFTPAVGETRAALWAERYGPTLARVGEGAIEGGVGTAALQPLEAARDQAFQEQYGPLDAFMNVAFGTVLGGGLHAGFGKLTDLVDTLRPETRESALAAAVAQSAEGRPTDISSVIHSEAPQVEPFADAITAARTASADFTRGQELSPAISPTASDAATRDVQAKAGDDIEAEYQNALAQVDHYERQGILTPEEAAQARSGSEDLAQAKSSGNAAEAAARCLLLHP